MLTHEGRAKVKVLLGELVKIVPQIHSIVETQKGYIEEESSRNVADNDMSMYHYYNKNDDREQGSSLPQGMHWRVRVPSHRFDSTMQQFRQVAAESSAVVVEWSTTSRDVTETYVDATSRAGVVNASRQALQVLLHRAPSVAEIFRIQQELTRLTQDYESHRQRAQRLAKDSSFSTIYWDVEEQVLVPRHRQPRGPRLALWKSAHGALNELAEMLVVTVNELVYWIVLVFPLAILAVILWHLLPLVCQCTCPATIKTWERGMKRGWSSVASSIAEQTKSSVKQPESVV
mmetsp:Transcript_24612/g.56406  ORF Transcript_24612/g.56406 Transcript_24612/m.56406 type:complete len:288 (+) Transcript_24612:3-866(+)